jgi:hypothetical protein
MLEKRSAIRFRKLAIRSSISEVVGVEEFGIEGLDDEVGVGEGNDDEDDDEIDDDEEEDIAEDEEDVKVEDEDDMIEEEEDRDKK